jgi:hypothetical protein
MLPNLETNFFNESREKTSEFGCIGIRASFGILVKSTTKSFVNRPLTFLFSGNYTRQNRYSVTVFPQIAISQNSLQAQYQRLWLSQLWRKVVLPLGRTVCGFLLAGPIVQRATQGRSLLTTVPGPRRYPNGKSARCQKRLPTARACILRLM